MAKMKNLNVIEEEILKFLRKSFSLPRSEIKPELEKFLNIIKQYEKDRYATRAFSYLDIVSWVESKLYSKPMNQVIREKYLASNRRIAYGTL